MKFLETTFEPLLGFEWLFWFKVRVRSHARRLWCVVSGGHRHAIVVEAAYFSDPPQIGPAIYWPDGELFRAPQPVGSVNGHLCERCRCHMVKSRARC